MGGARGGPPQNNTCLKQETPGIGKAYKHKRVDSDSYFTGYTSSNGNSVCPNESSIDDVSNLNEMRFAFAVLAHQVKAQRRMGGVAQSIHEARDLPKRATSPVDT